MKITEEKFDQIKAILNILDSTDAHATSGKIAKVAGVSGATISRVKQATSYTEYKGLVSRLSAKAKKVSPEPAVVEQPADVTEHVSGAASLDGSEDTPEEVNLPTGMQMDRVISLLANIEQLLTEIKNKKRSIL